MKTKEAAGAAVPVPDRRRALQKVTAVLAAGMGSTAASGATVSSPKRKWDGEYDWIVVGAGAAGCAAAIAGHDFKMKTLLLERSTTIGGITSQSGGVLWVPQNHVMAAQGIPDSRDAALKTMQFMGSGYASPDLAHAFVENAATVARYLEEKAGVRFTLFRRREFYFPMAPGSMELGRLIIPQPFPAETLGAWRNKVRNLTFVMGLLDQAPRKAATGWDTGRPHEGPTFTSRSGLDQWRKVIGDSLVDETVRRNEEQRVAGASLIGYLFRAVATRNVDVRADSNVLELLRSGDRIEGVVVANGSRQLRYRARKGVMLSTGRHPFQKEDSDGWRLAAAVRASTYTTSLIGVGMMNMRVPGEDYPDGFPAYRVNYETYMPHSLVVNRFGERFGNESFFQDIGNTFNQFDTWGEHCFRNIPCYLVFDQNALDKYSFAGLPPGNGNAQGLDWVPRAGSLAELAGMLQIDAGRLQTTVSRFNELARVRKDEDFKRSPISLGVLDKPPFFGIRFGTEPGGSLVIDPVQASTKVSMSPDGQAMDYQSGDPIHGLYSSGTLATGTGSKVWGIGTQGGFDLAAAVTWAYLGARHAATAKVRA